MENITCKACQAVVDLKLEFCSSCGEWLGLKIEDLESSNETNDNKFQKRTRIPQIRCNNCGNNNLPSVKNCKECGLLLVRPLSNYGATELPTRKEVPGVRAVFFLALIIPLIAGASYFYNTRLAFRSYFVTIFQVSTHSIISFAIFCSFQEITNRIP